MELYTIVLYGLISWALGFSMGIGMVYYMITQYAKKLVPVKVDRTKVTELYPRDRN